MTHLLLKLQHIDIEVINMIIHGSRSSASDSNFSHVEE